MYRSSRATAPGKPGKLATRGPTFVSHLRRRPVIRSDCLVQVPFIPPEGLGQRIPITCGCGSSRRMVAAVVAELLHCPTGCQLGLADR